MKIRIARIFPKILGLNGSLGNAEVIETRLRWWGIDVAVDDYEASATLGERPDLVVIGHGTSSMLTPAANAIDAWRDQLVTWYEAGTHFFGAGLGGDLLGESVAIDSNSPPREGLGLTPVSTVLRGPRASLEVCGMDHRGREVAGYLNDAGIRDSAGAKPLLSFLPVANESWSGNTAEDAEGVLGDGVWATAVSGPFLALNPAIADDIVASMLDHRDKPMPALTAEHERVDESAEHARAWIRSRI